MLKNLYFKFQCARSGEKHGVKKKTTRQSDSKTASTHNLTSVIKASPKTPKKPNPNRQKPK